MDVHDDRAIRYTIRRSRRARHVGLSVYPDGSVIVVMPFSADNDSAERFVQAKAAWVRAKIAFFAKRGFQPVIKRTHKDYLKYKDEAGALIRAKLQKAASWYGVSYGHVSIKDQKTRWGSCSRKGNLNFNYKILFLPEAAQDYIIVHELCHLKEFNHSKKFWALVAETVPNHRAIRQSIRRTGLGL